MTRQSTFISAGLALMLAASLAGCANTTTTLPQASPASPPTNVAGQYTGTVRDSVLGPGTALGDFSQSGTSVGGRFDFTYRSQQIVSSAAMIVAHDDGLSGSATATIGSAACTFRLSAHYDRTDFMLTGMYSAAHGCSGESGSFALKEQCYYAPGIRVHETARRSTLRPNAAGLHGC